MRRTVFFIAISTALTGVLARVAIAQSATLRKLDAARLTQSVRVDGRLDEAVWQGARWTDGFTQREPREGEPATQPTRVAVAYDNEAVYVGARMFTSGATRVRERTTRRDVESTSDQIVVSLDTFRDRRTAYSFGVTAAGVRIDYYHPSDDHGQRDYSFDPVWEAAAITDSAGWSAELRIPFGQLRYDSRGAPSWGVNVMRRAPDANEESYWVLVPKDATGWASRFGEIRGLEVPASLQRVELVPYVAAHALSQATRHPGNPFEARQNVSYRTGADIRVALGSNVAAEATVNPDFGQVEADPAEVNLTVFETLLTDRRPFFTEGRQLLTGGGAQYFYSRRIGAPPRIGLDGDFVEQPASSRILGAAKLTARTPGGTSVGIVTAVTAEASARSFDTSSTALSRAVVQPRTLYAVARVQQQFGASASTGGGILTAVARDLDGDASLSAAYPSAALTGATDWQLRFRGGEYVASMDAGFSRVHGAARAISRIQESSARYYQRPDAEHARLDTTRTRLEGYRLGASLGRNAGRHWLWRASASAVSPGFELNDVGRITQADVVSASASVRYRENQPSRLLRGYSINLQMFASWNHERTRLGGEVPSVFADATLPNFWTLGAHYHRAPRATSTTLTRGGPAAAVPADQHVSLNLAGNPAGMLQWSTSATLYTDELGRRETRLGASLAFRPQGRIEVSAEPSWLRIRAQRQYVAERADGPDATFGRRYVFANADRDEFAVELRAAFSMTPDLSLELYAQPFVSAGRFLGLGELREPNSMALRTYGTDGTTIDMSDGVYMVEDGAASFAVPNPDFTVQSLRSNLVLRWEWRSGSTLFAVWQQDRSMREGFGRDHTLRGIWEVWRIPGDHRFAIKATYWLAH